MAETESETPPPRISRKVQKSMVAFETAEGVGARVKRSVGTPGMWNPSPFLILDWVTVERGAVGYRFWSRLTPRASRHTPTGG